MGKEKVNLTIKKTEIQEKTCKVIVKSPSIIGFMFEDCGISTAYKPELDKDELIVSYVGSIGKQDFEIVEIK